MPKYPDIRVKLIGENGNAFAIIGACCCAARKAKLPQTEIDAFKNEAISGDYDHLLATAMKWFYVD